MGWAIQGCCGQNPIMQAMQKMLAEQLRQRMIEDLMKLLKGGGCSGGCGDIDPAAILQLLQAIMRPQQCCGGGGSGSQAKI